MHSQPFKSLLKSVKTSQAKPNLRLTDLCIVVDENKPTLSSQVLPSSPPSSHKKMREGFSKVFGSDFDWLDDSEHETGCNCHECGSYGATLNCKRPKSTPTYESNHLLIWDMTQKKHVAERLIEEFKEFERCNEFLKFNKIDKQKNDKKNISTSQQEQEQDNDFELDLDSDSNCYYYELKNNSVRYNKKIEKPLFSPYKISPQVSLLRYKKLQIGNQKNFLLGSLSTTAINHH